jgi:pimeloyl-ACP methyl ester carboxylesterase
MKCPESCRNDQARPVQRASWRRRAWRFRPARRLSITAVAAGTSMAALAPVTAAGATERSASPSAISWAACGTQLECARVPVPLDWAHHGGRIITLSVIRHLASHPDRRIGSLFVNPGGPGDSGVDAVASRGEALDTITGGRFDVVGWDPRGSGGSTSVSCFADSGEREAFWQGMPVPTTPQDEQRYLAKSVALAQRCGARNGDLLAHISTADTARDLDYLRSLVGDSRLTFLGESTGTFLGQTYANMFPHRVRAMALDGLEDPVSYTADLATALASTLTDSDRVFHEFLTLCERAGPAGCALAGHGPVDKRAEGILQQLRQHPAPAPSATPPGELTYGEMLTLLKLAALRDPAIWPDAAGLLEAVGQGDASAAETIARGYAAEPFHRGFEQGTALLCADSPARQNARQWPQVVHQLEKLSFTGGRVMGWLHAACASWPTHSAHRYTGPWNATTINPILLIGTRFDPNTPLANAQLAERRLGNAVLLTHDGYGHLSQADPSACVMQALGSYLVDLVTPPRGTTCPSDHLPFDPNFGQPAPSR